MGRWILMPRPKINGIELNKRDINIRQVYVTIGISPQNQMKTIKKYLLWL